MGSSQSLCRPDPADGLNPATWAGVLGPHLGTRKPVLPHSSCDGEEVWPDPPGGRECGMALTSLGRREGGVAWPSK